jgi:protein-L-isoaspartate(D-aspartate) O-methyltransferase
MFSVADMASVADMVMAADRSYEDGDHDALGNFLLNLRARGLRDTALLNAIERAPRPSFLPLEYRGLAYQQFTLPLPCGQEAGPALSIVETINALQIEPHHHVLEIGTGSGWQTALIAGLAQAVVSVERWKSLAETADARLQSLGLVNAVVAHGDGSGGVPAGAPFDRILFNVAIDALSPLIQAQLAEGGMVLAPVISADGPLLTRFEKQDGRLVSTVLGPSSAAELVQGAAVFL